MVHDQKSPHKKQRFASQLHAVLGKIFIKEFDREQKHHLVTITDVLPSEDLSRIKVYLSVLGKGPQKVLESIQKREPYIRHCVSHELKFRRAPHFTFVLDTSLDAVDTVEKIFDTLKS